MKNNKVKSKKKNIVLKLFMTLLFIAIITLIVLLVIKLKNVKPKNPVSPEKLQELGIDPNNEAYRGMEIYEQEGDVIIDAGDGGKTILPAKKDDSGLKELTEQEREKYKISDVNVASSESLTTITGKVQNTDSKFHKLIVNVKFYSEEGKIVGANSAEVSVSAGETKDFQMNVMDNLANNKYNLIVEYAD